ncbi:hypothetical protein FDI63_gp084 [Mycobacterium phage ChrisnMich]|uniref:Uncharacterized protein n=1 Tax=Mycobacterium phage ChrisnMich TaxID=1034130 RepID=G1BLE1_9CAUD|nr:hypothetical protein FDI63_gp084 [Mycobacterium phage ChrisnMich]AEJ94663.1 hypothetical protein CHRISNMICH_84 [Mycobacterium phage ChrisnMich]
MDANMTNAELAKMVQLMGGYPCGPDCRQRYGWCFTHNISTGTGTEPWRP